MLTVLAGKYRRLSNNHPNLTALLWIAAAGLAAFGIMIPRVGFYGDDWGYIWLLFKGGGIEMFFRNNRENIPPIFSALSIFLGDRPLAWQLYNLLLRSICAFLFWKVLHEIWPTERKFTLLTVVLWLIFPGYRLSYVAVNMSTYFIVLSCYFFSVFLQLKSLQQSHRRWLWILPSLLLSFINITFTEYYFFAELIRPIFLFYFINHQNHSPRTAIKKALSAWLPFALLFLITIVWRANNQGSINSYYSFKLLDDFKENPFQTILAQIVQILQDGWTTVVISWVNAVYPIQWLNVQHFKWFVYIPPLLILTGILFVGLTTNQRNQNSPSNSTRINLEWLALGFLWIVLCGWPVWLAKLRIGTDFASTRFALPIIPGAVITSVGLVRLLVRLPRIQTLLIAILLAGSILFQNLLGNAFRMDWIKQKELYTQLSWRFPSIEPGSLLAFNLSPSAEGEENSMSAAINWFFSQHPGASELDYYAYYIPERFEFDTEGVFEGQPKTRGHHIGSFTASREKVIGIEIDPRNCIRVLYPGPDEVDGHLPPILRFAAKYSSPRLESDPNPTNRPEDLERMFGKPVEQNWCWAYQQADLLRQKGDWQEITQLAGQIVPDEYKKDWQKLTVFIEAYARTGQNERATKLLQNLHQFPPSEKKVYCEITRNWLEILHPEGDFLAELNAGRKQFKCK